MKLNTTSQYAIRAMQAIARDAKSNELVRAKTLAEELDIPYKYLTKVMTMLLEAGLLTSVRGRVGGYLLAKDPQDIRIMDITQAVNECHEFDKCILGLGLCRDTNKCALHEQWTKARDDIVNMLENTTLQDLVEAEIEQELFRQDF